ncbi:MAG: outer membrane beta-barrel protein [Pseudomonadota bacterium]
MAHKRFVGLVFSAALLFGGSVHQAGAQSPAAELWDGFYIGAHAGAVDSALTMRDESGSVFDAESGTYFVNGLSGLAGLHGGYSWQQGSRVLGFELDYSWTNTGRKDIFDGSDHDVAAQLDGFGSIRGRAGLAVNNAHIFVTGGVGFVDASNFARDSAAEIAEVDGFSAFVIGAGAEFKLRGDLSARLDALHYNLIEEDDFCDSSSCGGDPQSFGGALNVLRVGLSYHIGGEHDGFEVADNDLWSGFYLGAHTGALQSSTRAQDDSADLLDTEGASIFTNDIAALAGVHGGYNHVLGSALIGVELDHTFTDSGFDRTYIDPLSGPMDPGPYRLSSQIDSITSLRARVGVTDGNAQAYVTGGGAWISGDVVASDVGAGSVARHENFGALVVGAGSEVMVASNVSLRGEFLYYAFDEDTLDCAACGDQPFYIDGELLAARIGASYHLNNSATVTQSSDVADWSGFYGGGHVSYVDSQLGVRDEAGAILDPNDIGVTSFRTSQDIGAGLYGGYNLQWGNAVAGLELDYTFTDAGETRSIDDGGAVVGGEIDGFGSLRGRVGVASGKSLFYVTGGVGFVDADFRAVNNVTGETVSFEDFTALVAGAGAEFKISENVSARAEYFYYGMDEDSSTCGTCIAGDVYGNGELNVVRAGLTYHFD